MRIFKKLTITLALLLTAVTGAWAQSSLNVVEFEVPAAWANDNSYVTTADLPGFKAVTLEEAKACAPTDGFAVLFYAFDGENASYVFFQKEGSPMPYKPTPYQKNVVFSNSKSMKYFYTAEPTEWDLTPDETGKTWTLAKMPANDIELQVEYFAESYLYLSKDVLADKANINVTAGELGVQFGEDGKSANTITEGTAMTVKYNGTKKILGMKVEKKSAVTYPLLSAATSEDIGKVVCAAGHLHDAKTAVPDGCTAVGILGKVTETGHGLILALKNATSQTCNTINGWTSVTTYASTTLKVLPDDAARSTNLTSYTTLGETTVSNWAVAQKSDYEAIFQNLGSTNNKGGYTCDSNVNAYITTGVGGTEISSYCWSATNSGDYAWSFNSGGWVERNKTQSISVRPVLGF